MVHRVTQSLINLIGANSWEHRFKTAIKTAKESGAKELADINTLTDLYNYLDAFLHWLPSEDKTGLKVYQELCAYHYVLGQPSVIGLQSTIYPGNETREELSELSQWMVMFSNSIGTWLDEPGKSLTEAQYKTFLETPDTYPDGRPGYRVSQYKLPGSGVWWNYSFNDFFTREFKDIATQRPVGNPDDPLTICNGADSSFDGAWPIEDDATVTFNYKNAHQVEIKSLPYNISQLLDGSEYSKKFAGGTFMHAFLGPADYHRQHSPVDGEILEAKVVPGNVYLEVYVKQEAGKAPTLAPRRPLNPIHHTRVIPRHSTSYIGKKLQIPLSGASPDDKEVKDLDAPDFPGYQFSQARGMMVIKTEAIGLVAFLPIGMSHVSSVVIKDNIKPGYKVKKGEELSKFMFGGSDYIMCFQRGVKLDFDKYKIQQNKWYAVRSPYIQAELTDEFQTVGEYGY
ncbi:hypothetical protein TWF225_009339 [Orbilia oligospora]|nr:hypothetical protein TWF225_009339 [Orbilia oligospora]KAF3269977.1 hypothetical protein TWF217_008323 [Orbilia oligospora]KAF3270442.1 hypothetical protein TWF128_004215 [Orbilia oligospora]KAF3298073.1 hypothetical protein TWF132_004211 [Orbilia oligospora]